MSANLPIVTISSTSAESASASNSGRDSAFFYEQKNDISPRERRIWLVLQVALIAVISIICVMLFVKPELGLLLLWRALVPVAPLLVVLMPGVWRNICPLATIALLPHHFKRSRGRLPNARMQGFMALAGLAGLLLLVPLRHVGLDRSGPLSGLLLLALAAMALLAGWFFGRKSGWCSGLCPIHPVERLYGSEAIVRPRNVHCSSCVSCVAPCPDSVPALDPRRGKRQGWPRLLVGTVMLGGFPGFVFGWFQVPSQPVQQAMQQLDVIFGLPLLGGFITTSVFVGVHFILPRRWHLLYSRIFAASAVATYYIFGLPTLLGWSLFGHGGVAVDLRAFLPAWTQTALQVGSVALIFWLLVLRHSTSRAWMVRPPIDPILSAQRQVMRQQATAQNQSDAESLPVA